MPKRGGSSVFAESSRLLVTSESYIFANGTRFDGEALMAALKAQHAVSKRYEEKVTEPDVQESGNTEWIAYVNQRSVANASGTTSQKIAGIGLPAETARHLKDRLHARLSGAMWPQENRGDARRDKEPRIENNATQ
jgi:hypothetical protein